MAGTSENVVVCLAVLDQPPRDHRLEVVAVVIAQARGRAAAAAAVAPAADATAAAATAAAVAGAAVAGAAVAGGGVPDSLKQRSQGVSRQSNVPAYIHT